MNIFYLHSDVDKCAEMMFDSHVVKMPLEYVQMLCTAIAVKDPAKYNPALMYKPTHEKHPCTEWVMKSISHWEYLKRLTIAVGREWNYRWHWLEPGLVHKSVELAEKLPTPDYNRFGKTDSGFWEPPQCMPQEFHRVSTTDAYRDYYLYGKKRKLMRWTNRPVPDFMREAWGREILTDFILPDKGTGYDATQFISREN